MEVKKLKECCTIIAGQSPESKYYNSNGDGLPFFKVKPTSVSYIRPYECIAPNQRK